MYHLKMAQNKVSYQVIRLSSPSPPEGEAKGHRPNGVTPGRFFG